MQVVTMPPQAGTVAPDTATVLSAFKDVCWAVPDQDDVEERAKRSGWQSLQVGKHLRADRLKNEIEGGASQKYQLRVQQFERAVGDRLLLLTVNRGELTAQAKGFGNTVCTIRELSDPRPLDPSTVGNWLDVQPSKVWQDPDGSLGQEWYSIRSPNPTIVKVGYIAPGSALAGEEMMPGIYLSAEAHGDRK